MDISFEASTQPIASPKMRMRLWNSEGTPSMGEPSVASGLEGGNEMGFSRGWKVTQASARALGQERPASGPREAGGGV